MAARSYRPPREWLVAEGKWPIGPFTPGAPPYVMVTAGIDATSLGRTLAGETVPDVHTVAVLEDALQCELWPVWATRGYSKGDG